METETELRRGHVTKVLLRWRQDQARAVAFSAGGDGGRRLPEPSGFDRWHFAHFMLVVKGLAHVPMRGPAHSLTASIWSSVIVSV
jgi:hypothetical protein